MSESVFLVAGLGGFGMQTCQELSEREARVIAVDNSRDLVDKIKDTVNQAYFLDTTDESQLSTIPVDDVDIAIVAIGDNIEANILTTALLKQAGIPYIISRASTDLHKKVLMQVGANEIIDPEKDAGRRLAEKILAPDILDSVPLTMDISIAEIYLPESFIKKRIKEIDLPGKMNLTICGVKREKININENGDPEKKEIVVTAGNNTVLEQGDMLFVIGRNEDISRLKDI